MWDKDVLQLISSSTGEFSLICVFLSLDSGFSWAFTTDRIPQRTSSSFGRSYTVLGVVQGALQATSMRSFTVERGLSGQVLLIPWMNFFFF